MKGKSKEEKAAAKNAMLDKAVTQEMSRMSQNGKDFCDNVKRNIIFILVELIQVISFSHL